MTSSQRPEEISLRPSVRVERINRFHEFIDLIQNELKCGHWLFRGLKESSYELLPTLAREFDKDASEAEIYEFEREMLRRSFSSSVGHETNENSHFNQLLLAQHHGAPTRLLDWTASALVAAYFASEPTGKDTDFKITAAHTCPQGISSTYLNSHDLKDWDFFSGYHDEEEFEFPVSRAIHSLRDQVEERGTMFVQGSDVSPRVSAQQGLVSIQREIKRPLDEQMSENVTSIFHIVVCSTAREEFQDTLYQLGMRRRSLFPDFDTKFEAFKRERLIHQRLCEACTELDG